MEIVSLIVLLYPSIRGLTFTYCSPLILFSLLSQLLMIVLVCARCMDASFLSNEFWMVSIYTYVIQSIQTMQAFSTGLMTMVLLFKNGFTITKRWVILLAMFVSLSYGVLCMFGYFLGMYLSGLEVINALGGYVAQSLNANMMSTAFVSTFISAVLAIIFTRLFKRTTVEGMILEGGSNET